MICRTWNLEGFLKKNSTKMQIQNWEIEREYMKVNFFRMIKSQQVINFKQLINLQTSDK